MSKRKDTMSTHSTTNKKKRHCNVLRLENAPPVSSIQDLIEIGKSIRFYKNLDTVMLWKISPYLEELNKLIGMKELKDSVFYQIIYYLKGMHKRDKNQEYLHTMILGDPGCGKCHKIDTPIMLHDGTIKMVQHIEIGDKLMGDDSTPRKVLSLARGRETMYKIEQLYGDDYTVNESHIISLKLSKCPFIKHFTGRYQYSVFWFDYEKLQSKVFSYNGSNIIEKLHEAEEFLKTLPSKGTVIDIPVKDYVNRSIDWKSAYKGFKVGIDFNNRKVDLDPYILGYCIGKEVKSDSMIIINDKEPLEYFKSYFSELACIKKDDDYTYHFTTENQCEGNGNIFMNLLHQYNVINNKHIPSEYKFTDKQTRLNLLAGLLDSDGHYVKGGFFDIIQKRKDMAEDIVWLSRSLGFRATLTYMKSGAYRGKNETCYRICISGHLDEIPCKISRKKVIKRKKAKDPLSYGIRVHKLDEDDYYGFEINRNHRFLLGDFTVTHNTTVARIIGKIYQTMGILSPTSVFKVAHRDDFIAEYLGQTAIKTRKLLESCIGGVLFVDEVYSLGSGSKDKDSFSKEAMETLTAFLSEHKKDFCFIGAGYEEDVKRCFFGGNDGLERRFQWVHKIEKYTPEELTDIMIKMVREMKWRIDFDKKDVIKILKEEKDLFKHAGGDIETFITKAKMVHAKRVFSLDNNHMFVLTKKDLNNAIKMVKKYRLVKKDVIKYPSLYM